LINFGPEAHAAYFGAKYTFGKTTVWFDPIINDWYKDEPEFDINNEFYQKHKAMAKYLAKEGKGKFFVSMSDNASAADALAYLRGTDKLLMDFLEDKENVKKTKDNVLKEWLYTEREFYDISKDCNEGGSCVGWLNTWAPDYHTHIQCDLSVMISPEIYKEFILDELRVMCDSLDHSIYHLDGIEQLRHLDMLLSLEKLDMIQWTQVEGQKSPTEYIPELKKIQAAGKCLHLSCSGKDAVTLMTELSSKGLYIVTGAANEEDADDLLRLAGKLVKE
jgi:hypothetical protein